MLSVIEKSAVTFFWTASFADDSELLPLDPFALNYLAQEVGLWLFPTLTTRTSRAQYYCVVHYGIALVDSLAPHASDEERMALSSAGNASGRSPRWSRRRRTRTRARDAMRGMRGAMKARRVQCHVRAARRPGC